MQTIILAALTVLCGGGALYLWMLLGKAQDTVQKAHERAQKAEAEAAKHTERSETLRRKLEKTGDVTSKDDRAIKDSVAKATVAKEELKKVQAALKRAEALAEEQAIALRKQTAKTDELIAVLAERTGKKPVAAVVVPVEAAPAVEEMPALPPVDRPEDPKVALRRLEIENEREARKLEQDRLRAEREVARGQLLTEEERENLHHLRVEREKLAHMVFQRELDLRIERRISEHNRRAYIITSGQLELVEDELYRRKHGRERPEFTGHRPDAVVPAGVDAPDHAAAAAEADAAVAQLEATQTPAATAEI